jgi:hypothetical protein
MAMKRPLVAAFAFAASFAFASGAAWGYGDLYNNWNTDGCDFTDHAGFMLRGPTRLTAIELWYRWGRHESEVGYEIFQHGRPIQRGVLMRAGCDPYQESWCGARDNVGIDLPPGYVEIRVDRGKVCQNRRSRGEGFIHAFGGPARGPHGRPHDDPYDDPYDRNPPPPPPDDR